MIKGNIIRLNTLHLNSASMNGVREVQGSSASGGGGIVPIPPVGNYIQFADAEVERVLMANGVSSDGVGITIEDAEKVTSIGTWFKENTTIQTFDELKYFTNVKAISAYAFFGCTALQWVNCENIESIKAQVFNNSGITELILPKVITIPYSGLVGMKKVTKVVIGASCTNIDANNIWSWNDKGKVSFIFEGATPPTFSTSNNKPDWYGVTFYVPDASLEAYKTATNWSAYADRIHPLSEIEGSPYIQFEDAEVERVLMANGVSSDGIGITKEDAANVTSIGSWFKDNKAATSFNEINYFINLEEIEAGAFYNATNLVIDDLNLKNLKKLYYGAFNSTKVRKISSLGNVTSLMDAALNVGGSFQNCDELTEILQEVLDKITDIGNAGFTNCDNLRIDLIMPSLEVITQGFARSPIRRILNLGNITQLFGDTMLGYNTYPFGQEYDTMIIPSSVTRIGRYAFAGDGNMKALIVKASTPPSLAQAAFSQSASTCGVYVPDSSVESYKAEWSAWSNRIRPISQFATDNPTLYAEIQQYL